MKYDKNEFIVVPNTSKIQGLAANLQVTYMWLCFHSDGNMESFPSRKLLAQECGMSMRTLDRCLDRLVIVGLIVKSARVVSNKQTSNLYQVVIESRGDKSARGGDKLTPGGATKTAHRTQPNTNSTQLSNSTNVELATSHGKQEINEAFEYWHMKTGIPISSKTQQNRYAANNLLKKHGTEKVRQLINGVATAQGDKFAPRIADFIQLQSKLSELIVWGRQQSNNQRVVKI